MLIHTRGVAVLWPTCRRARCRCKQWDSLSEATHNLPFDQLLLLIIDLWSSFIQLNKTFICTHILSEYNLENIVVNVFIHLFQNDNIQLLQNLPCVPSAFVTK